MKEKARIEKASVAITFDKKEGEFVPSNGDRTPKTKNGFRFLILKKKGTWTGWQFCQGKIDKGESEEQAVLRELKEETNLDGKIVKKLDLKADYWFQFEGKTVHKFLTFFLVKADSSKEVKIDVEHSDWKWVDYETALKEIKFNKEQFQEAYKQLVTLG